MKFRRSLLVKYFALVCLYLALVPLVFFGAQFVYYHYMVSAGKWKQFEAKYSASAIEDEWHETVQAMNGLSDQKKREKLVEMKKKYPEATIFWVDQNGRTMLKLPETTKIPDVWTPPMAVKFMKDSVGGDPFTVVALLGEKQQDGFMTIQISRSLTQMNRTDFFYYWFPVIFLVMMLGLFLLMTWFFFFGVRRRLVRLQDAMLNVHEMGEPIAVPVKKDDEISDLERSFNRMVQELQASRKREREEEQLRRDLIANLSHDLRTPLTVLRGHAYSLEQEQLSPQGQRSLAVIDEKIRYLDRLIDNLLSFSLLTAGRYPYHPQSLDVIQKLRQIIASWYPVFEKDGFHVEVDLPERPLYWHVDPEWFQRIWDNLLQNVWRYAREGKYVSVSFDEDAEQTRFILTDRGPGIARRSRSKGAGIGLSIVALMAREMGLEWRMESSHRGTRCILARSGMRLKGLNPS